MILVPQTPDNDSRTANIPNIPLTNSDDEIDKIEKSISPNNSPIQKVTSSISKGRYGGRKAHLVNLSFEPIPVSNNLKEQLQSFMLDNNSNNIDSKKENLQDTIETPTKLFFSKKKKVIEERSKAYVVKPQIITKSTFDNNTSKLMSFMNDEDDSEIDDIPQKKIETTKRKLVKKSEVVNNGSKKMTFRIDSDEEDSELVESKKKEDEIVPEKPKKRKLIKKVAVVSSSEDEKLENSSNPKTRRIDSISSSTLKTINLTITPENEIDLTTPDADLIDLTLFEHNSSNEDVEVVDYFNTTNASDIMIETKCPEIIANLFVLLRPFSVLSDILLKFEEFDRFKFSKNAEKKKLEKIISKIQKNIQIYSVLDKIVKECENQGKNVAEELTTIGVHLKNYDPDNLQISFEKPQCMSDSLILKSYQLMGIAWLNCMYSLKHGCILADDMGLGKTVQVIGMISHLFDKNIKGPYLICVPSSVLDNWAREFEKFSPNISVFIYHGAAGERAWQREEVRSKRIVVEVMITTYGVASSKVKEDRSFLKKMKFTTLILDEGHMMKNMLSARYQALMSLNIPRRILLTGTPLQNNLGELMSLLTFAIPDIFSRHLSEDIEQEDIQKLFLSKDISSSNTILMKRIQKLKLIITPFILRRSKDIVLAELKLPNKVSRVEICHSTNDQWKLYEEMKERTSGVYKNDTGKLDSMHMMELRKVACHPLLLRRHFSNEIIRKIAKDIMKEPEYWDAREDYIYEDLTVMSDHQIDTLCFKFPISLKKYTLDNNLYMESGKTLKLKEILPPMIAKKNRILIFSQFVIMLDILEKVMETLKITYLRMDGTTDVIDRQSLIDNFTLNDNISIFLLSTKACGLGLNLTSSNTVILYDMDFNPHNDLQAEDRVHRVGQTSEVEVLRLILKDTIEERIYEVGRNKMMLDEEIKKK